MLTIKSKKMKGKSDFFIFKSYEPMVPSDLFRVNRIKYNPISQAMANH